mgnify:CR=1 FL=1
MAIYDVKDPTGPELITLCTAAERDDRFKHLDAFNGRVSCVVRLNPSYEAHFSMTPDHARDIAVRLIDAAEKADFEQAERTKKAADELQRAKETSELRKLSRKTKR